MALTKVQIGMTDAPTSGAAVTASGTSVDFNSIPATAKRITVMFSGVSTSGSSIIQVQIGSGSVTTSGYTGAAVSNTTIASYTAGIAIGAAGASGYLRNGALIITNLSGNIYTALGNFGDSVNTVMSSTASSVTLGGTLDRVRITTVNGTDTFDAGTINIMYE